MTPTLLMSSWISLQLCLITCRLSALRLTWPSSSSSSSSSPGRPEPGASAERKQPITATRSPQRPANAPQRSFRSFCPDQTSSPAVCSELRAPDPAPQSLSHTHTQPTDYDLFMFLYHTFVGAQIIQYNIIIIAYNPNINNL